jgi:hypothetical protein
MFNSTNEHATSMEMQNQRQEQQQQSHHHHHHQQQQQQQQQRSIIPKTKQRRLQSNPKWLASQQSQQINNNASEQQQQSQPLLNPPKLVIHDFLGHFQPICFVFNTRRPPHNVPRIYNNAPIMASPFLYGHPGMVTHAINREKQRIKEYKRKQCEKRRAEKLIENGVNINGNYKQQQYQQQTNSKSNSLLHQINLKPKNLSGYCENCTWQYITIISSDATNRTTTNIKYHTHTNYTGRVSYRDLNEHIQSKKHLKFEHNTDNYTELLNFTNSLYNNDDNNSHSKKSKKKNENKNINDDKNKRHAMKKKMKLKIVDNNNFRRNINCKIATTHTVKNEKNYKNGHENMMDVDEDTNESNQRINDQALPRLFHQRHNVKTNNDEKQQCIKKNNRPKTTTGIASSQQYRLKDRNNMKNRIPISKQNSIPQPPSEQPQYRMKKIDCKHKYRKRILIKKRSNNGGKKKKSDNNNDNIDEKKQHVKKLIRPFSSNGVLERQKRDGVPSQNKTRRLRPRPVNYNNLSVNNNKMMR